MWILHVSAQISRENSGEVKWLCLEPWAKQLQSSSPILLAHTTLLFLPNHTPMFPLSTVFYTSVLSRRLYQCSFSFLAEPHEICDEESLGSVVWKETPAGDAAAVRCPRNATGKNDCMLWSGSWPTLRAPFILCFLDEENLVVGRQDKQMDFPPFTQSYLSSPCVSVLLHCLTRTSWFILENMRSCPIHLLPSPRTTL